VKIIVCLVATVVSLSIAYGPLPIKAKWIIGVLAHADRHYRVCGTDHQERTRA
jgi:hypothetical protein